MLGHLSPVLRLSWTVMGLSWTFLGLSWAVLGLSWAILALSWPRLGPSWHPLGPSWHPLGPLGQDPENDPKKHPKSSPELIDSCRDTHWRLGAKSYGFLYIICKPGAKIWGPTFDKKPEPQVVQSWAHLGSFRRLQLLSP